MKKVIILGATGSIGQSSIEIARKFKDKIQLVGLSAHYNDEKLSLLGNEFSTSNLVITGKESSNFNNIKLFGMNALIDLIHRTDADIVINGIAGSSGLLPSVATIKSNKDLGLANKETMVMAGSIINNLIKQHKVNLIPVDSEHSAIFHLLENGSTKNISEIILTASGGAFRDLEYEALKNVTLEDALKHPTWDMGKKITIDSASMANKGLEVIEAARLFDIDIDSIKVLIHPQSYVHSMVRKNDNALYAHISAPDMKLPIQNAIFYPDLVKVDSCYLDLANKELTFKKPDYKKYKMLELAYEALKKGEVYTIAYNAINEVLVDEFCKKNLSFLDIANITKIVLSMELGPTPTTIEEVIEIDNKARELTKKVLKEN